MRRTGARFGGRKHVASRARAPAGWRERAGCACALCSLAARVLTHVASALALIHAVRRELKEAFEKERAA
eukprot:CAMPEP_0119416658 /NCGR_PEP_ID=MMETSP1335-20130426/13656_1 /TAXON_ID=259385 /ORGANISM="Chrysoculter rhomboideus, Strain RCC1486" /LENGTH=69 /DNA_ID=CAMNT_0007441791 /DNA_START=13 /DNA_END=218 /DNA_ORIENTATION=-